jgi:hypothetical protein
MLLKRFILTAIFLVIAYGGYVQSQAFSAKALAKKAPPLLGVFESVPHLWEIWIVLLAPLAFILRHVGAQQYFDTGPAWFFWTVQALYFYLIAWLILFLSAKLFRRHS